MLRYFRFGPIIETFSTDGAQRCELYYYKVEEIKVEVVEIEATTHYSRL